LRFSRLRRISVSRSGRYAGDAPFSKPIRARGPRAGSAASSSSSMPSISRRSFSMSSAIAL
jgi:hypothetical protein